MSLGVHEGIDWKQAAYRSAPPTPPRGPLLAVSGLSIGFPTDNGVRPVVDSVGFELQAGETLAIVGESGSGKTMLGRALIGLLPDAARIMSGTVVFGGRDVLQLSPRGWCDVRGAEIGLVFQEPMVSLNPAHRIGTQMIEGLRVHRGMGRDEARRMALAMLHRVQVRDPLACMRSYPHEFSGGMRQRILLAGVMLLRPKLLIADEPTTALDCVVQKEVLDLMVELTHDEGAALVFISHNLPLVATYTDRVLVMRRGVVVETGPVNEVLSRPRDPYTLALLDALPKRHERPAPVQAAPLLEIGKLAVDYPEPKRWMGRRMKRVVYDVSLDVLPGETVAIVGESGSGKTTLTRAVLGLVPVAGGSVSIAGSDLATAGASLRSTLRRRIQVVFQDPYSSLDPRMHVGAIVAEGLRLDPALGAAEKRERVATVLADVGLDGYERRLVHELSGGQRQRVAIARALVMRPDILIADEPVSALDVTVQAQVLKILVSLQRAYGFGCLLISHDLGVVEQIADRVHVMLKGRIVESGSRDAIFDRPQHPYTRRLLNAVPGLVGDSASGFRIEKRVFEGER